MENIKGKQFGIIILAAGNSSRLGRPKQLVSFQNQSLLQHSLQVATGSGAGKIVVVLGAYAGEIQQQISLDHHEVVLNRSWQEGMASSIRRGINALLESSPAIDGAILMVCDQPYVNTDLLQHLFATHLTTGKGIIACGYGHTKGTPVFFHRDFFPALQILQGDSGAKKLIRLHANIVAAVPFSGGEIDIDREEDIRNINTG